MSEFHEAYADLVAGLPPSQIREAHKRLTTCKQPLTAEELTTEHPRVQACLEKIAAAYTRKKARSATSSKLRRDTAREEGVEPVAVFDTTCRNTQEPDEPVVSLLDACSLEPVEVECASATAPHMCAQETVAEPLVASQQTVAEPPKPRVTVAVAKHALVASQRAVAAKPLTETVTPAPPIEKGKAQGRKFFTNQK